VRRISARLALLAVAAAIVPACGGSGGSSSGGGVMTSGYNGAIVYGAPAQFTVKAFGGRSTVGVGGSGGFIAVHNWGATDGKILKTGTVDASFPVPTTLPTLGSNPKTISANTALTVGGGLTAGINTILGDDNATTATGLRVLPGITLTLSPQLDIDNADADNNIATGTFEMAQLAFADGVIIEGTIKLAVKDGSVNTAAFELYAETIVFLPGSKIDTNGAAGSVGFDGANAGNIRIQPVGQLIMRGTITAVGGDGDNGGNGGTTAFYSERYSVFNTGTILTSGGTGSDGTGGIAGGIWLQASIRVGSAAGGGLYNSGTCTARGGNGTLGGGAGNYVYNYYNDTDGPLYSSATIDGSGGDATIDGSGGNAGYLVMNSVGGETRVSGTLTARGGKGLGAAGKGGAGNLIQISANTGTTSPVHDGCFVGANMDSSGGEGAVGGNAGTIEVWNNANYLGNFARPGHHPVVLVGFVSFEARGGDGATHGGFAGSVKLYSRSVFDPGGSPHFGGLFNEVPVVLKGGTGGSGNGGFTGTIFIGTEAASAAVAAAPDEDRVIENTARLEITGGDGAVTGGNGNTIQIFDRFHAKNSGTLLSRGGAGGTGPGGFSGAIVIQSDGITENEADLSVTGGSSGGDQGGDGGGVIVEGKYASHQGLMLSNGGHGSSNRGGNGGNIELGSWNGAVPTSISGVLNVKPGTGVPDGTVGIVTIDGIRAALVDGTLTFP
jgi:hypothetical protein